MKRPILIGIGASHSGSGKTFLASTILRHYTGHSALPITHHASRLALHSSHLTPHSSLLSALTWGAIKCTRTSSQPELITDHSLLMTHGKDTWQMLTSGAKEVVWVRSDRRSLPDLLPKALKRLSCLDLIIVEGNSAIELLKPDIVIFIFGKGKKRWKSGIDELAAGADIVLNDSEVKIPTGSHTKKLFPRSLSGAAYRDFFGTLTGLLHERRADAKDVGKGC